MTDQTPDDDDLPSEMPATNAVVIYDPGSSLPDERSDAEGDGLLSVLCDAFEQEHISTQRAVPEPGAGDDILLIFAGIGAIAATAQSIDLGVKLANFVRSRNKRRREAGCGEKAVVNQDGVKVVALAIASEGRPGFSSRLDLISIYVLPIAAARVSEQEELLIPERFHSEYIVAVPDMHANETVVLNIDAWLRTRWRMVVSGAMLPPSPLKHE